MTDVPDPMQFHGGRVTLHHGDAREALRGFEDNSIHSVVTDPPYSLRFMSKKWDCGDTAFNPEFWAEVLRVLKPGTHLLAFGGTRTYHRLVCAIEDAGFEIRDQLIWAHGQGFAKKGYIFKDDDGNAEGPLAGQLKPSIEPICLARKPLSEKTIAANVLRWGTGAMNIDECRIGIHGGTAGATKGGATVNALGNHLNGECGKLVEGLGRWPANFLHDGSKEVLACFPDDAGGGAKDSRGNNHRLFNSRESFRDDVHDGFNDSGSAARFFASFPLTEDDKRIHYTAKANFHDRAGAAHPTIKPVVLMQWLVRLITPKAGLCLDPFAGTGTTAEACFRDGMRCILIEREDQYIADIRRRMELMICGPNERLRESIKARGLVADAGPLFGGGEVKRHPRPTGTIRTGSNFIFGDEER